MEPSVAVGTKKAWSIVRTLYYMLRKGIGKKKIALHLSYMMKRSKHAGKALNNLMFQYHHHQDSATTNICHLSSNALPGQYEYTCKTSKNHFFSCVHAPPTAEDDEMDVNVAVLKALEMLHSEVVSPALPGLGRSPAVRITDSPYPVCEVQGVDNHVDEAAEEFIIKFYKNLRKQ